MKLKNIFLFASTVVLGMGMTSCADDDLGASIFDTNDYPLDRSLYTFPLDTFAKKNFLEPFNLKYIYKMEDIGSDLQKNLTPAAYDKAVSIANGNELYAPIFLMKKATVLNAQKKYADAGAIYQTIKDSYPKYVAAYRVNIDKYIERAKFQAEQK